MKPIQVPSADQAPPLSEASCTGQASVDSTNYSSPHCLNKDTPNCTDKVTVGAKMTLLTLCLDLGASS